MKNSLSAETARKSTTAKNIAALAGGTISAMAFGGIADGAVVAGIGAPLTVDTGDGDGFTVDWDVDGVGGIDFQLSVSDTGSYTYLRLKDGAGFNGFGFVANGVGGSGVRAAQNLMNGAMVQASPTGPGTAAYGWGGSHNDRTVLSQYSITSGSIRNLVGFSSGVPGNIGFRFTNGGNTHYGWASVTATTNNSSFVVNSWAYESAPNMGIEVGAVPEPSVSTLGLLAAGAAGLRRRRRKQG